MSRAHPGQDVVNISGNRVRRAGRFLTHIDPACDDEDALSNTMVDLWKKARTQTDPMAFLKTCAALGQTIAQRRLNDLYRRGTRRRKGLMVMFAESNGASPSTATTRDLDRVEFLRIQMEALPPCDQYLLEARAINGMSWKEVSRNLFELFTIERTDNACEGRYRRIRSQINRAYHLLHGNDGAVTLSGNDQDGALGPEQSPSETDNTNS